MAKWRISALLMLTVFLMTGGAAKAAPQTDDLSPADIAADEPVSSARLSLPPPDTSVDSSCPARLQILIDKSQSSSYAPSPLENLKPDSDKSQTMQVYVDCRLKYNWPVSTGRERQEHAVSGTNYFSSTPAGNYRLDWRTTAYHSRLWNAPMPYAQFFLPGIAIHATEPTEYHHLGRRASGGCVRLHLTNAKKLYDLVDQYGAQNVLISITDGQLFDFN